MQQATPNIANNTAGVNVNNTDEKYEYNPLKVLPENIPDELKQHHLWGVWVFNPSDNPNKKRKKIPINPTTGAPLKPNSTEGWVDFKTAFSAYDANQKYAGIGILLTEDDPFVGVDLDDCMDDDSLNDPIADDIRATLDSYTERSPSGTGLRIICKRGRKPLQLEGNRNGGVEMYTEGRFLTITGCVPGDRTEIRRCPTTIIEIHQKYIAKPTPHTPSRERPQTTNNSPSGYGDNTPSGLDFALCCKEAKAGKTVEEIKQALIAKGSNHEKYNRDDYVDRTAEAAYARVNDTAGHTTTPDVDWRSLPRVDHAAVAHSEPIEPDWIIEDWLRRNEYLGQLVGEQQTGKSYLVTVLCYCIACGRSYGPFTIPKARRVIYLNVEDPKEIIDYRCKKVMEELKFSPEEMALIKQNLVIIPAIGKFGPINQGYPNNREIKLLESMINDFKPDLIIGDTKSRLSCGDENSNSGQADLVRILEKLIVQYGGVFLMAHHPTKSNPMSSRGGGAWESNIRLTINLVKMDAQTGNQFGFSPQEARDRAFTMTCNDNYGGQNTAYFYKDPETGLPRPIAPEHNTAELVQEWLLDSLKEHGTVNKRALLQTRGKDDAAVAAMLDTFPIIRGDKKEAIAEAVAALIESDRLYEIKEGKSSLLTTKRPAPTLLRKTKQTPQEEKG